MQSRPGPTAPLGRGPDRRRRSSRAAGMTDTAQRSSERRIFAVLAGGILAYAICQNVTIPIIPALARHYDTSLATATWTLTGYYLAAAVLTPVLGRLGDMFGKRRMLVISLAGFCLGNVVAAAASS